MNKTAIITGVSRGLGKALAEAFLQAGYKVIGIGRNAEISAPNFSFFQLDLSDHAAVEAFHLPKIDADEITLINNAGILGEVKRISATESDYASQVMQVNVVAPIQLTAKAARLCGDSIPFTLVNISSGAGKKRPIPSWAAYCASKAALDLFSETFLLEEKELGRNTRVYAFAPGVVDTDMQQSIRSTDASDFSSVETFRDLKENNELADASQVAQKLLALLVKPYDGKVICSARD